VPPALAAEAPGGDAGGQDRLVGLLELVVGGGDRSSGLLEEAGIAPGAERGDVDRGAVALAEEGHAVHAGGAQGLLPAVLVVVRREVEREPGLDEGLPDLAAPDLPDVRGVAAEDAGAELVGELGGAGARNGVQRGADAGVLGEGGELFAQERGGVDVL